MLSAPGGPGTDSRTVAVIQGELHRQVLIDGDGFQQVITSFVGNAKTVRTKLTDDFLLALFRAQIRTSGNKLAYLFVRSVVKGWFSASAIACKALFSISLADVCPHERAPR